MPQCEDFPCCGHEQGCCPDFDESGRQLNMVCTCGARHNGESGCSLCVGCMRRLDAEEGYYDDDREWDDDDDEADDYDDGDRDMEEQYENAQFEAADEWFGGYDDGGF
jgi:hypothetical protein